MLQAVETKWDGRWETEEKEQGAVEEKRARGVHPHGDGKSPQAIERKGVEVRPLRKRVRKPLEVKELNDGNGREDEVRVRSGVRIGAGAWQTRGMVACGYGLVK